jgi:hypothetical protein
MNFLEVLHRYLNTSLPYLFTPRIRSVASFFVSLSFKAAAKVESFFIPRKLF